jgi:hypothetical protein
MKAIAPSVRLLIEIESETNINIARKRQAPKVIVRRW